MKRVGRTSGLGMRQGRYVVRWKLMARLLGRPPRVTGERRTASGHGPTSYEHCVLRLQVPPTAGTARVTFEVVDGRYPILSVPMLVASGHRVILSWARS